MRPGRRQEAVLPQAAAAAHRPQAEADLLQAGAVYPVREVPAAAPVH